MSRIQDDLRTQFDLAGLHHAASRRLSGEDWRDYTAITERYTEARASLEQDHARTYPERLRAAQRQVIDEAATRRPELRPPGQGHDRFAKDAIEREAHRRVQHAHAQDRARLDRAEATEIDTLLDQAVVRARQHPEGATPEQSKAREQRQSQSGPKRRRSQD